MSVSCVTFIEGQWGQTGTILAYRRGGLESGDCYGGNIYEAIQWFLNKREPSSIYGMTTITPGTVTVFYRDVPD